MRKKIQLNEQTSPVSGKERMLLTHVKVFGNTLVPPPAGRAFAPVMICHIKLPYLSERKKTNIYLLMWISRLFPSHYLTSF